VAWCARFGVTDKKDIQAVATAFEKLYETDSIETWFECCEGIYLIAMKKKTPTTTKGKKVVERTG